MSETDDKILNELKALRQFFIEAEEAMTSGQDVDLTDIDDRINDVCNAVQEAPKDQQAIYLPILSDLLEKLNSCDVTMQAIQQKLDEEASS